MRRLTAAAMPLAAAALLLVTTGCDDPLSASYERPLTAQDHERLLGLYDRTADCLGMTSYGHDVIWVLVGELQLNGHELGGAQRGNTIWLRTPNEGSPAASTVAHESMHHILERNTGNGDKHHSRPEWETCGRGLTR